jgi:hypothetical protein
MKNFTQPLIRATKLLVGYFLVFILGITILFVGAELIGHLGGGSEILYHWYLLGVGMIIYSITFPAAFLTRDTFSFIVVTLLITAVVLTSIPIKSVLSYAAQNAPQVIKNNPTRLSDYI